MYKVAFEESTRALKDQLDELSGIRQRLVQYLAFIGTATAFLVGSSLKNADQHRDRLFITMASGGTALMLASIVGAVLVLWPSIANFKARMSAERIIWPIERPKNPITTDADFYKNLAIQTDKAVTQNTVGLDKIRILYFVAIICGAVQLVVWILLVWLRG